MSNKQIENKIIKKRRGQLPGLDFLDFRYYDGGEICGNWGDVVDNFLKEALHQTRRKAINECMNIVRKCEKDNGLYPDILIKLNNLK